MKTWWCYRGDQAGRPWRIEVTRAPGHREACAAFHVASPSVFVHELTDPRLIADCADLDPGDVGVLTVQDLPLAVAWARSRGYR